MTMNYMTPTPNQLYDHFLPHLKESELKVLLVVIRKTLGWIDRSTGGRKKWDRISISQFRKHSGLSSKSIAGAIQSLIDQDLIEVRDETGVLMHTPGQRRMAYQLLYAIGRGLRESIPTIR